MVITWGMVSSWAVSHAVEVLLKTGHATIKLLIRCVSMMRIAMFRVQVFDDFIIRRVAYVARSLIG